MERCPKCGQHEDLEDFPRNRSSRDGRGVDCKPCHDEIGRRNRTRRHGSTRNYHLKHRYGISAADPILLAAAIEYLRRAQHEPPPPRARPTAEQLALFDR